MCVTHELDATALDLGKRELERGEIKNKQNKQESQTCHDHDLRDRAVFLSFRLLHKKRAQENCRNPVMILKNKTRIFIEWPANRVYN